MELRACIGTIGGTRRVSGDEQGRRSNLAVPMESNNTSRLPLPPYTCRHQEITEGEDYANAESARKWKKETDFLVKQLSGMHVTKERD